MESALRPWAGDGGGIELATLDTAELAMRVVTPQLEGAFNGTPTPANVPVVPYVRFLPLSWRAQVVRGRLYLTDISAMRPWLGTAAAPKLLLLETLKRYDVPDVDIVVAQWDNPVVSRNDKPDGTRFWGSGHRKWLQQGPLPVFSPSTGDGWLDLPFPDFTFTYPKQNRYSTPGWRDAHAKGLEVAEREGAFETRVDRALFSGNCKQPSEKAPRRRLAALAVEHPDKLLVNNIVAGSEHSRDKCVETLDVAGTGGLVEDRCSFRTEDMCSFKYLVSVSTGGSYSGRFKYLMLCGSVVIHVRYAMRTYEFFETQLEAGEHYVEVDDVNDIPAAVAALKADPERAARIAAAGQQRMRELDMDAVLAYVYELLVQYSRLQNFAPEPAEGAHEIACEDDLHRHYGTPYLLTHDNETCVELREIAPPGWGGAFDGSLVDCRVEGPPEDPDLYCREDEERRARHG